jgi:hypothetical protein
MGGDRTGEMSSAVAELTLKFWIVRFVKLAGRALVIR